MKRANHLIPKVIEPDNLRLAFWKARKGRNGNDQVITYRANLDQNLSLLAKQIESTEVDVGHYSFFKIFDPKERDICASSFQEQVLHHALMNICHPYFERKQIFHSYACRQGKGTYAAIKQAKTHTKNYQWYLKLDIKKFFASVHHEVIKKQQTGQFKDSRLLLIFGKIIDSYEDNLNRGVPLGNLTSQYFGNHYLCELDHLIKEQLQVKAYVRYMDDLVLWHQNKNVLQACFYVINTYVTESLKCTLKPRILNQSKFGLSFLGRIYPNYIGLTQRSKKRYIKKMNHIQDCLEGGIWDQYKSQRKALPLVAFIDHADALTVKKTFWQKRKRKE